MIEKRVFRSRVLLRVVRVYRHTLKLCIPGWNTRSFFQVPRSLFPKHFKFERGYRFHGTANKAAETPVDLDIQGPFEEGHAAVPSWAELKKQGIVVDPLNRIREG